MKFFVEMDSVSFYKGQTFKTYQMFQNLFDKFCLEEKEIFRKKTSDKIKDKSFKNKMSEEVKQNLVYSRIIYKCKFGDDVRLRGQGDRNTRLLYY